MKIKYNFILIYALSTFAAFAELQSSEIIPKFYEILSREEKPSIKDEKEFFGGSECDALRKVILSKVEYSMSSTPVWDYVIKNKSFFMTKGLANLNKARIQYSDPVHMVRLWNKGTSDDVKVYTTFPTEVNDKHEVLDTSVGIFTLGKNCYLDIGITIVAGTSRDFFGYVYHEVTGSTPGAVPNN